MKHKITQPGVTLESIYASLETTFPNLKLRYQKSLMGKHIVAQKTNSIGAGIWIKKDMIKVEEMIPSSGTAALAGVFGLLGLLLVKYVNRKEWKQFNEELHSHIRNNF